MVIYCTYDKSNSSLVSRHRYVVAQNNNLSDTINIKCVGMTDPTAYGYYIDFVCLTHGGAVKAAYSSPALEYGENGLDFDVPNCLTQYEGYVEAQLVIYEKSRASVVAKSVGRTGGIFEVAASVNSLETRVVEPANMLTALTTAVLTADNLNEEVAKTVEQAKEVKEDIESTLESIDGRLTETVKEKMTEVIRELPLCTVEFWFYDKLAGSVTVTQGKKLTPPEYVFPSNCTCEGWYYVEEGRAWDFDVDVAGDKNMRLYADCHNALLVEFADGVLRMSKLNSTNIYLPFTFGGQEVKEVYFTENEVHTGRVYVNDKAYDFTNLASAEYVVSFNNERYRGGKYLVDEKEKKVVGLHSGMAGRLTADNLGKYDIDCKFSKNLNFDTLIVESENCKGLESVAKGNYLIYTMIIKDNTFDAKIGDFFNLQAVILLSDTPNLMKKLTFTSRNANCKIYVPSYYMKQYEANSAWAGVQLYPLEEFAGVDYSQTIYPSPEEFV